MTILTPTVNALQITQDQECTKCSPELDVTEEQAHYQCLINPSRPTSRFTAQLSRTILSLRRI